jgi:succinoglycan biosynthesis protein ExoO
MSMDHPEITVTMPAYNRADLIAQAIESVQSQTMSSWELVIVDDGSTDATLEIARSYAKSDRRIKIFQNERNLGIGKTRNHALMRSTGRFITPLDSDDWYQPPRLERMLAAADAHGADLLSDDLLVIRHGEEIPSTTLSELCGEPLLETLEIDMAGLLRRLGFERDGIAVGLTKPLIRRQFLIDHGIQYDTTLQVVEDYWMLADCVAAGAKFIMIPEAHYYYRLHAAHTTSAANSQKDIESTKRRLEAFLASDVAATDLEAAEYARYHVRRMQLLSSYATFTHSIKDRRLHKAAWQMVREPSVMREFITRLPLVLERRRRARQGDPFAFDPLSGGHRSRKVPVSAKHTK